VVELCLRIPVFTTHSFMKVEIGGWLGWRLHRKFLDRYFNGNGRR
jgi:hypothetical protein